VAGALVDGVALRALGLEDLLTRRGVPRGAPENDAIAAKHEEEPDLGLGSRSRLEAEAAAAGGASARVLVRAAAASATAPQQRTRDARGAPSYHIALPFLGLQCWADLGHGSYSSMRKPKLMHDAGRDGARSTIAAQEDQLTTTPCSSFHRGTTAAQPAHRLAWHCQFRHRAAGQGVAARARAHRRRRRRRGTGRQATGECRRQVGTWPHELAHLRQRKLRRL
jgi:hypothetical protein